MSVIDMKWAAIAGKEELHCQGCGSFAKCAHITEKSLWLCFSCFIDLLHGGFDDNNA